MKTAIIILNYNNAADTRACIQSILDINTADVKFIVADNASRPDELSALKQMMADLFGPQYLHLAPGDTPPAILPYATLVETGGNIGYGKGNNAAIRLTISDKEISRLLILNNDVLFIHDFIPALITLQDSIPDCAIISPVLLKKDRRSIDITCARRSPTVGSLVRDNLFHYWRLLVKADALEINRDRYILYGLSPEQVAQKYPQPAMEIELPSGSCMLVRKDYFLEIGAFDPATFMYYEENILFEKIRRTGRRNYLAVNCQCVHLGAATTSTFTNVGLMSRAKESEKYYVQNYSGASAPVKWLHAASVGIYMAMVRLQKKMFK